MNFLSDYSEIPVGILQELFEQMMSLRLAFFSKQLDKDILTCIDTWGITGSSWVREAFRGHTRYILILSGANRYRIYSLRVQNEEVLFASGLLGNIQEVSTVNLRNAYYFVYDDYHYPLRYRVSNINRLQEFKRAISSIYNFGGINLMLNGVVLVQMAYLITGVDEEGFLVYDLRIANISVRTSSHNFESVFEYDIAQGCLLSYCNGVPVLAWNTENLWMCNAFPSLPFTRGRLRLVEGGSRDIVLLTVPEEDGDAIARVAFATEVQTNLDILRGTLIDYQPLKTFIPIICSPTQGNIYIYGFSAMNSPRDFSTIFQLATAEGNQSNLYFFSVASFFIQEKPPIPPFFEYEGLEVWLNPNGYLLIYEPTFYVPFLQKNESSILTISDLVVKKF